MAKPVSGLNPTVLKWARERAGYEIDQVAKSIDKDPGIILSWESGEESPTYVQLEKLAYTLYKRPIAIFFLPAPPEEPQQTKSFRTLPDFEISNLEPDTLYALRQAKAMQLALAELNDGDNPSKKQIFVEIEATPISEISKLTTTVREYLEAPLSTQINLRNTDAALRFWRDLIQDHGVFVFKRSFKQGGVSGFCFWDDSFPIIYLNSSSANSRQIFTLFHELGHILLHTSGVTKADDSYISSLRGDSQQIEIFCNRFASEFLVPSNDFEQFIRTRKFDDHFFSEIASRYKVSREVILRKVFDRGLVSSSFYRKKAHQWNQEYEEQRQNREGGPSYYATQASYLGRKYLDLAFGRFYQGRCSIEQLADYLNVKVSGIPKLENFAARNAA